MKTKIGLSQQKNHMVIIDANKESLIIREPHPKAIIIAQIPNSNNTLARSMIRLQIGT
jgi:hypothetical protein